MNCFILHTCFQRFFEVNPNIKEDNVAKDRTEDTCNLVSQGGFERSLELTEWRRREQTAMLGRHGDQFRKQRKKENTDADRRQLRCSL